ncbi:aminobutyraldehyde dehydrogenase [Roseicyclus sp. F158]|uniref:Aminobutyraldehyde dehydrogenase n=1 Tax=Tropicimonas omnivorans TaxID=3075590 RepID=A0ABU3DFI7_9RHOB|nr:aminobutyraldehyde dehydrogenase [Roseicyclus sp. F158]MDT0682459.1 aminobutyraldehyde dehydrogenase [Roseicyclus sp. F158]
MSDFETRLLIDGDYVDGSAAPEPARDPSRGEVIADVGSAAPDQIDHAVQAAHRAFQDWRRTTPKERSRLLWTIADRIDAEAEGLAALESLNAGKVARFVAGGEIPNVTDVFRYFATAARNIPGVAANGYRAPGMTSMLRRDPIGVVASIAPWNYPLLMAAWKLAPALAAGNTVVIKPSENTPLSLLALGRILSDVLPKGVVNILCGGGEAVGRKLIEHDLVRMISLTGDVRTGRAVLRSAAANVIKRTHLELGGKAPVIVMKDADLDAVASTLREASFYNAGQDCTAACRVLADAAIADELTAKLEAMVKDITWGAPNDEGVEFGPVISAAQRDRIDGFVSRAREGGAEIVVGGHAPDGNGYFFEPTLVRAPIDAEIVQKEVFGPVVTVTPFSEPDEALRWANASEYGLASSVWSQNGAAAMQIADRLEYGVTWINTHGVFATEMPHGGMKNSGYGSDLSMQSLLDYTQARHVLLAG